MSMSDPLGDLLTRIRNAQSARQTRCKAPASKLRENVLDVLKREGFIRAWRTEELRPGVKFIDIELKYSEGEPAIREITRVSKPGRRVYSKIAELPKFYNGLGMSILSTPRGVMSENEARAANVGGEVLCAQNHATSAEFAHHIMMQRAALTHRHTDHAALGAFRCFADRLRHFARLASPPANTALFIAHNHQCREAEATTTLHHLRHAIDGDQLVLQLIAFLAFRARLALTLTATATTALTALAAFTTAPWFTCHLVQSFRTTARPRGRRPRAP